MSVVTVLRDPLPWPRFAVSECFLQLQSVFCICDVCSQCSRWVHSSSGVSECFLQLQSVFCICDVCSQCSRWVHSSSGYSSSLLMTMLTWCSKWRTRFVTLSACASLSLSYCVVRRNFVEIWMLGLFCASLHFANSRMNVLFMLCFATLLLALDFMGKSNINFVGCIETLTAHILQYCTYLQCRKFYFNFTCVVFIFVYDIFLLFVCWLHNSVM